MSNEHDYWQRSIDRDNGARCRSLAWTDSWQSRRIFSTWHIHQSLRADRATISQGPNQKFISGVFFSHPFHRSFPFPFLPFPLFIPPRSGPSDPAKGFGRELLTPPTLHAAGRGRTAFAATTSPDSKYTKNTSATELQPQTLLVYLRAQGKFLMAENVILFLF